MAMTAKRSAPLFKLEDFEPIEDIPLQLCAELDRTTISVRALLELGVDSLLPLSRPTGENIDIYAGDVLIGSGEILVIDSNLAIRFGDLWDRPNDSRPKETLPAVSSTEVQVSSLEG